MENELVLTGTDGNRVSIYAQDIVEILETNYGCCVITLLSEYNVIDTFNSVREMRNKAMAKHQDNGNTIKFSAT
jgi:hypothetical protein